MVKGIPVGGCEGEGLKDQKVNGQPAGPFGASTQKRFFTENVSVLCSHRNYVLFLKRLSCVFV